MLSVGQAVFLRRLLVLVALMAPVVEAQRGTASAGRTAALIPTEDCHAADTTCVPPPLEREFRGLWVASVSNIDWPSKPGLPVAEVKRELEVILDRAQASGLNAVILQVRPAGDALYKSSLEPWSEYLTGKQGRAPEGRWDPLTFAVESAHQRGLELHAWFNPYRARHPSAKGTLARSHLTNRRPALVKRYGTHLWMDPGEPAVLAHTVRVVMDVVRRYDIDGVHVDDYFYPYKERDRRGQVIEFPDAESYARYQRDGGTLARDDWRRDNVDRLVHALHDSIHVVKPWVKFGVSPSSMPMPGSGCRRVGRLFRAAALLAACRAGAAVHGVAPVVGGAERFRAASLARQSCESCGRPVAHAVGGGGDVAAGEADAGGQRRLGEYPLLGDRVPR